MEFSSKACSQFSCAELQEKLRHRLLDKRTTKQLCYGNRIYTFEYRKDDIGFTGMYLVHGEFDTPTGNNWETSIISPLFLDIPYLAICSGVIGKFILSVVTEVNGSKLCQYSPSLSQDSTCLIFSEKGSNKCECSPIFWIRGKFLQLQHGIPECPCLVHIFFNKIAMKVNHQLSCVFI